MVSLLHRATIKEARETKMFGKMCTLICDQHSTQLLVMTLMCDVLCLVSSTYFDGPTVDSTSACVILSEGTATTGKVPIFTESFVKQVS